MEDAVIVFNDNCSHIIIEYMIDLRDLLIYIVVYVEDFICVELVDPYTLEIIESTEHDSYSSAKSKVLAAKRNHLC